MATYDTRFSSTSYDIENLGYTPVLPVLLMEGAIEEDESTPGANILEYQDGGNRRKA